MEDIKEIQEALIKIAKKIDLIEDKDLDYVHNERWIKLKNKQERYYNQLAKAQLEFYEEANKKSPSEYKQEKIKFYKEYIEHNTQQEN